MRFVAGRGAVAEAAGRGRCSEEPSGRCWWPGAAAERLAGRGAVAKTLATPWQRAIGKKLLTGSTAVAKMLLTGVPGARFLIQQRRHVQKAFLQRSNC